MGNYTNSNETDFAQRGGFLAARRSYPRALRNRHTNLCLDYDFRSTNYVNSWECHGDTNQQWYFENEQLKSNYDDKCLDYALHAGDNAVVYGCHWGNNQLWRQHGEELRTKENGKCLDTNSARPFEKGAPVEVRPCNGGRSQQWQWVWWTR